MKLKSGNLPSPDEPLEGAEHPTPDFKASIHTFLHSSFHLLSSSLKRFGAAMDLGGKAVRVT